MNNLDTSVRAGQRHQYLRTSLSQNLGQIASVSFRSCDITVHFWNHNVKWTAGRRNSPIEIIISRLHGYDIQKKTCFFTLHLDFHYGCDMNMGKTLSPFPVALLLWLYNIAFPEGL